MRLQTPPASPAASPSVTPPVARPPIALSRALAQRAPLPKIALELHEHLADGSVLFTNVTLPPTNVVYGKDGKIECITLYLPICSYCANRITGVRVQPQSKQPNRATRFGKWLLGVK